MSRAILLVCLAGTVVACDTTGPDPGLPVKVELLDWAIPPDSLIGISVDEWWSYPPIVEIEGGDGAVVINGDYTLPTATSWLEGVARYEEGTLVVLIDYRFDRGTAQLLTTPKLDYRLTVSSVRPGVTPVLVRYNVWEAAPFGDIGWGETDVLRDTVVVR